MERFQRYKGFDPNTTDYARSLGYPLIQVVGDENRFQELGESNDNRLTSVDMAMSCPDTVRHDDLSSSTPNDTPANKVPDTETDEVAVGSKWESKAAGSSSKRRKVHTNSDHGGENEDAMAESRKRHRTVASVYAKDP
ncbi:hypothetical protein MPER_04841 [Moniliophthora perniciosa FA553]|nr:hypothetical protein MPER_04841 [Moniliophthora perniciosa FA553]